MNILKYLTSYDLDYDYSIASCVFIYVGVLSDVFLLIAGKTSKAVQLAFSTEHRDQSKFFLEPSGRYSRSKNYIETLGLKLWDKAIPL